MANENDAIRYTAGGQNVPAPPKPGEMIICQVCGQPILPSQFSKNPFQRKYEFKWHLHPECKEKMYCEIDRSVPGLVAERKQAEKRAEQPR